MKHKKTLRILKDNLLVLSGLAAFFYLVMEVNDKTPLGNAGEIITTILCGAWLMLLGYAQFSK